MNPIGKTAFLLLGAAAGAAYMFGMPAVEHAVAGALKPPPPACETRAVPGAFPAADIRAVAVYLRKHPVPRRHGMIAGIVTADYCGGGTWAQLLVTSKGKNPTIWCGKGNRPCPVPDLNDIGAYEYAPRGGTVRKPGDVQVITVHAVPAAIAEGA